MHEFHCVAISIYPPVIISLTSLFLWFPLGGSHIWWYGSADVYYVPVSQIYKFMYVIRLFSELHIFHEIAVVTYIKCFSSGIDDSQIEDLHLCTTWGAPKIRSNLLEWVNRICDRNKTVIIHPAKFSDGRSVKYARQFLLTHAANGTSDH